MFSERHILQKQRLTKLIRSLLSRSEKRNYIDAVRCLDEKPARTPAAVAAGAKSRYDDFVVTHILQTMIIHGTANFLAWHRFYLLAYEDTLRDECGYKGYQPYVNLRIK
jgi:tyrosinase